MKSSTTPPMPRGAGCALVFLSTVALGMGYLLADMLLFDPLHKRSQAQSWDAVPCVVRELSIKHHTVRGSRKSSSAAYSPKVEFEYSYHGEDYNSQTFWFSHQLLNTKEEAKELIRNYTIGGESMCWVNPKKPGEAVLNREHSGVSVVGGGFGLLIALLGGLGMIGSAWLCLKPRPH